MKVVSINGVDGVGKTTQLRLLAYQAPANTSILSGVHHYNPDWPDLDDDGYSRWWFEETSNQDLNRILMESYQIRTQSVPPNRSLVLLDRGIDTVEMVCIASAMAKASSYDEARALASFSRIRYSGNINEDYRIALTQSGPDPKDSRAPIERLRPRSDIYKTYQDLFHTHFSANIHIFDDVVDCSGHSIIEVQNSIRNTLSKQGFFFSPLLDGISSIAFLGSPGNSTNDLLTYMSCPSIAILNCEYLVESIRGVLTTQEYSFEECLILGLDKYSRHHSWHETIALISCSPELDIYKLKALLGTKLIAVNSDEDLPRSRSQDLLSATAEIRGRQKQGFVECKSLERKIESLDLPTEYRLVMGWVLDELVTGLGTDLRLLMLTGSGGRGRIKSGWSDLDFLVIGTAKNLVISKLLARLLADSKIKLGFTYLSEWEAATLVFDSRTAYYLRNAESNDVTILHAAPGFRLPRLDKVPYVWPRVNDLANGIYSLRRALFLSAKPRAIYKTLVMLLKIRLQHCSIYLDEPDDVIERFEKLFPSESRLPVPTLSEVIHPGGELPRVSEVATSHLDWLVEQLAAASSYVDYSAGIETP